MSCDCQNKQCNYPKQNINHLKNGFVLFQKVNNCGGNSSVSDKIIEITEDNINTLENIYLETINNITVLHITMYSSYIYFINFLNINTKINYVVPHYLLEDIDNSDNYVFKLQIKNNNSFKYLNIDNDLNKFDNFETFNNTEISGSFYKISNNEVVEINTYKPLNTIKLYSTTNAGKFANNLKVIEPINTKNIQDITITTNKFYYVEDYGNNTTIKFNFVTSDIDKTYNNKYDLLINCVGENNDNFIFNNIMIDWVNDTPIYQINKLLRICIEYIGDDKYIGYYFKNNNDVIEKLYSDVELTKEEIALLNTANENTEVEIGKLDNKINDVKDTVDTHTTNIVSLSTTIRELNNKNKAYGPYEDKTVNEIKTNLQNDGLLVPSLTICVKENNKYVEYWYQIVEGNTISFEHINTGLTVFADRDSSFDIDGYEAYVSGDSVYYLKINNTNKEVFEYDKNLQIYTPISYDYEKSGIGYDFVKKNNGSTTDTNDEDINTLRNLIDDNTTNIETNSNNISNLQRELSYAKGDLYRISEATKDYGPYDNQTIEDVEQILSSEHLLSPGKTVCVIENNQYVEYQYQLDFEPTTIYFLDGLMGQNIVAERNSNYDEEGYKAYRGNGRTYFIKISDNQIYNSDYELVSASYDYALSRYKFVKKNNSSNIDSSNLETLINNVTLLNNKLNKLENGYKVENYTIGDTHDTINNTLTIILSDFPKKLNDRSFESEDIIKILNITTGETIHKFYDGKPTYSFECTFITKVDMDTGAIYYPAIVYSNDVPIRMTDKLVIEVNLPKMY